MSNLRNEFKRIAVTNEQKCRSLMGAYFQDVWQILEKCNKQSNICVNAVVDSPKKADLLIMLKNVQADLLCSIDSFERGYGQTVENNLRMVIESYCLVYHMHNDRSDETWHKYQEKNIALLILYHISKSIILVLKNSVVYMDYCLIFLIKVVWKILFVTWKEMELIIF